jgi:hypothetical protein
MLLAFKRRAKVSRRWRGEESPHRRQNKSALTSAAKPKN